MTEDLISGLACTRPGSRNPFFSWPSTPIHARGSDGRARTQRALMYTALPVVMLTFRADVVVARTTPPCIQLWASCLGLILRVRAAGWIMDYHPEIGANVLARRPSFRWLAASIRAIDAFFLRRLDFAIVLDDAMERLVQSRAPALPLFQHPTWNGIPGILHTPGPVSRFAETGELCLVYAGSLGYSHPLETFAALISALKSSATVRLLTIGVSKTGEARFRQLAEESGITISCAPANTLRRSRHDFSRTSSARGSRLPVGRDGWPRESQ